MSIRAVKIPPRPPSQPLPALRGEGKGDPASQRRPHLRLPFPGRTPGPSSDATAPIHDTGAQLRLPFPGVHQGPASTPRPSTTTPRPCTTTPGPCSDTLPGRSQKARPRLPRSAPRRQGPAPTPIPGRPQQRPASTPTPGTRQPGPVVSALGPDLLRGTRQRASSVAEGLLVAEREGFEPSKELPPYGISSAAPSAGLGDLSA